MAPSLTSLDIREYGPGDRDACLALFDGNTPAFFDASERPDFERWLDAPQGPYVVLTGPERDVVACGGWALNRERRSADLCWGMVRTDLRGHGIGRLLTQARLGRIDADPNINAVILFTTQLSAGFYARMGFEVTATIPEGIGPGLDRVDMRRDARPSSRT